MLSAAVQESGICTTRPSAAVQQVVGYLWVSGLVADIDLPPLVTHDQDPKQTLERGYTARHLSGSGHTGFRLEYALVNSVEKV